MSFLLYFNKGAKKNIFAIADNKNSDRRKPFMTAVRIYFQNVVRAEWRKHMICAHFHCFARLLYLVAQPRINLLFIFR